MWDVTGWAALTWLKTTVLLALGVGAAWLALPAGSGWFPLVCIAAVLADLLALRALAREWTDAARWSWWWAR
jgi:polyferredoxin